MTNFIVFLRKEISEFMRSYKLLILFSSFVLVGIISPLTAKYLPEILEWAMGNEQIIEIYPDASDAWMQFCKNITQMGMIISVILFSGSFPDEFQKGTLVMLFAKGLKRKTVLISKFTAMWFNFTFAFWCSYFVCYIYSILIWNASNVSINGSFAAAFCIYIFGCFLISVLLLGSLITKTSYGTLLVVGGVVAVLFALSVFEPLEKVNPIGLIQNETNLITQEKSFSDFTSVLIVTVLIQLIILIVSLIFFDKQEILAVR